MSQASTSVTNNFNQTGLNQPKLTKESKLNLAEFEQGNVIKVPGSTEADLVCFSHLRWDFVYQRPQHLMSRFAKERRVFFIEEPIYIQDKPECLEIVKRDEIWIVVPHLLQGTEKTKRQKHLIDNFLAEFEIHNYIFWYYTPMALAFTDHLHPLVTIYDCMDELSAFKGAPPALQEQEQQLFKKSDLVFTGGQSLYEVKRHQHPNVYPFPSSIDVEHFAQAQLVTEPTDQLNIPHPRLGFYGVIDERMDIELLGGIANAKPDWHFIIIGPVVKIDPETLPRCSNIHYLGSKSYQQLPHYLSGWDVALLPFARNESTRFISPTKTPEYLAAAKPVVSTSIRDVVSPYGELGLVQIADTVTEFIQAIALAIQAQNDPDWLIRVNAFLAQNSWDQTWTKMNQLIESALVKL